MRRIVIVTLTVLSGLGLTGVADSRGTVDGVTRQPVESAHAERSAVEQAEAVRAGAVAQPLLIVRGTPDGEVLPVAVASYRGRVAKGATLTMNGEPVATERLGFWSVEVPLEVGENTFTFTATGAAGETSTVVRDVVFDPSLLLSHARTANTSDGEAGARFAARMEEERERG